MVRQVRQRPVPGVSLPELVPAVRQVDGLGQPFEQLALGDIVIDDRRNSAASTWASSWSAAGSAERS